MFTLTVGAEDWSAVGAVPATGHLEVSFLNPVLGEVILTTREWVARLSVVGAGEWEVPTIPATNAMRVQSRVAGLYAGRTFFFADPGPGTHTLTELIQAWQVDPSTLALTEANQAAWDRVASAAEAARDLTLEYRDQTETRAALAQEFAVAAAGSAAAAAGSESTVVTAASVADGAAASAATSASAAGTSATAAAGSATSAASSATSAAASVGTSLAKASNLSDLSDKAVARTNLGVQSALEAAAAYEPIGLSTTSKATVQGIALVNALIFGA